MIKIRHLSKKIDIISLFAKDYSGKLSGREIARLIKINHQTALNHLNDLVTEGILNYEIKGRNKEYYLDLKNLKTRMLLEVAESIKSLDRLRLKELGFIIEEILPFTDAIILFGSFASLDYNKESDIDLILVGKSDKERIRKITSRYNRKVNIEYVSLNDFAKSLKDKKALAVEIVKNHVFYGDISRIVKILLEWYLR